MKKLDFHFSQYVKKRYSFQRVKCKKMEQILFGAKRAEKGSASYTTRKVLWCRCCFAPCDEIFYHFLLFEETFCQIELCNSVIGHMQRNPPKLSNSVGGGPLLHSLHPYSGKPLNGRIVKTFTKLVLLHCSWKSGGERIGEKNRYVIILPLVHFQQIF